MTLSEFKAWFEGFTEGMDGPPSLKQWERIQARVKEISWAHISYPLPIDRRLAPMPYGTLSAGQCQTAMGVGQVSFAAQGIAQSGQNASNLR